MSCSTARHPDNLDKELEAKLFFPIIYFGEQLDNSEVWIPSFINIFFIKFI